MRRRIPHFWRSDRQWRLSTLRSWRWVPWHMLPQFRMHHLLWFPTLVELYKDKPRALWTSWYVVYCEEMGGDWFLTAGPAHTLRGTDHLAKFWPTFRSIAKQDDVVLSSRKGATNLVIVSFYVLCICTSVLKLKAMLPWVVSPNAFAVSIFSRPEEVTSDTLGSGKQILLLKACGMSQTKVWRFEYISQSFKTMISQNVCHAHFRQIQCRRQCDVVNDKSDEI